MASDFPTPLTLEPTGATHTHSFIFLHGLGSNGPKFGTELLAARDSSGKTLQESFPSMKFVFPTARKSRCTAFKRTKVNQWFNFSSLDKDINRDELCVDGLAETSGYIKRLIEDEVASGIPKNNIVLGGISQGSAASLYTLLTIEGGRICAYVGMCQYLPFLKMVEAIVAGVGAGGNEDEDDIVFDKSEEEDGITFGDEKDDEDDIDKELQDNKPAQAVKFLRENLGLSAFERKEALSPECLLIPVFLGHGALDERVLISRGKRVRDALLCLNMNVTWKEYEDLGHWYKVPNEIDDIVAFLKKNIDF